MPQPYKLFTIYAREDAQYLEELRGQLRPLEHAGRIRVWSDREINPGVDWEREIVQNLDTADIILILVSGNYFKSAYIHEVEIKRAFSRHERGEARLIPIIVSSISFGDDPIIGRLQVMPTDGKPVDSQYWRKNDDAWVDVVSGVKRVLNEVEKRENQGARNESTKIARQWGWERETEQKEKTKRKDIKPSPLRQYAAIGGGTLVLLLTAWLLPKVFFSVEPRKVETDEPRPTSADTLLRVESSPSQKRPENNNPQPVNSQINQETEQGTSNGQFSFIYPMEKINGSKFLMGDVSASNACPFSAQVKSFWMGKYEVTQAQWKLVMEYNPSKNKNCDNCPVENVSWHDIKKFIEKLNEKTKMQYRLPTEAEWEFAARGGVESNRYSGSNSLDEVAWYRDNSGGETHPVGGKKANAFGLFDMSGNVCEWCEDIFITYQGCTPLPDYGGRVFRGGAAYDPNYICTVFVRNWDMPGGRGKLEHLGFRLARD
ncbi:MAG: hypothetical protein OHK0019_06200 [Saprospiraceae bacterium]